MSLEHARGAKPFVCIGLNIRQSTASTDSPNTVELRYSEGLRDWQNLFTITRFREIEVLFHIYYFYQGKEIRWGDGKSQEKLKNFAGTTKNIMFSFLKKDIVIKCLSDKQKRLFQLIAHMTEVCQCFVIWPMINGHGLVYT